MWEREVTIRNNNRGVEDSMLFALSYSYYLSRIIHTLSREQRSTTSRADYDTAVQMGTAAPGGPLRAHHHGATATA
jgi:hypothetical protein